MKLLILTASAFFISAFSFAQIQNPVQWSYAANKKSANVYEVILTASLPKNWHIYSQSTPSGGPVPTSIKFNSNPLLTLDGKPKEAGNLKVEHDENFGIDVKYYADKVQFIQTVKLKTPVSTNVSGTVEYMVCNNSQCLPPVKKSFDVKLQ